VTFVALGVLTSGVSLAQDIPIALFQSVAEMGTQLSMPSDVGVGRDGFVYVVDGGNHQVGVFDATGLRVGNIGERGGEEGQFESPVGLGIGPKGEIWVADKGNQRLQMFSNDARFREAIPLEEEGEAIDPVDVAVSANGKELFVTTNNTHRVVVFSNKGKYLRGWGGEGEDDGQFRYPATIDIDPSGNVLVVDVLNARVQKFDAEGNFLSSFGSLGGKPGTFFRPKGIAVDDAGRSYVSDSYLGAIQVFDAEGQFLHALGEGGEATAFNTPVGMTADGSRLLVVQMLAGNVLVLEPATEAITAPDPEAEVQE
jgi:DNA-binding beta-propeller fold protein YncE